MTTSRAGNNTRVSAEADRLEAMIDALPLTGAQRNKAWDTWSDKGMPAALGLLGAFKAAYKAAAPTDEFDQLGQQFAQACRTRAMSQGADRAQVVAAAQTMIAQMSGTKPAAATKLTDSGDQSKPVATKGYNPATDALAIAFGADQATDPYTAAAKAAFGPENPRAKPEMDMRQAIAEVAKTRPAATNPIKAAMDATLGPDNPPNTRRDIY